MHARAVAFDSGIDQAIEAGRKIALNDRCKYFEQALVFVSPYVRARQTLYYLMVGAGVIARNEHDGEPGNIHRTIARLPRTYEDPRLREVELGYSGTHTLSLSLSLLLLPCRCCDVPHHHQHICSARGASRRTKDAWLVLLPLPWW
jgi:hypothetical protein